jgi:O-antigen/teichoic acid export membrane protein
MKLNIALVPTTGWRHVVMWQNVILQVAHLGAGGVLIMALWVLLGRAWGVEMFGRFNYLFTFAGFFGIVIDFGLDILLTRMIASGKTGIDQHLIIIKAVVIGLAVLIFAAIAVLAGITGDGPVLGLLMAGVVFLSSTTFLNGLLRGLDRLDVEAGIGLLQKTLFVSGAAGGALVYGFGPAWAAFFYLATHILGFLFTLWLIPGENRCFSAKPYPISLHLMEVIPLWGVAVFTFLALRMDVFMLRWLADDRALGIYTAGFRFIEGFFLFGVAFMAACFPRLVARRNNKELYWRLFRKSFLLMAAGGIFIFVVCVLVGKTVLTMMYGQGFGYSGQVLVYLAGTIPLIFLSLLMGQALIARQRQGMYLAALAFGLIVDFCVGIAAIPVFDSLGAVFAFWGRELVIFFILIVFTWKTAIKE